MFSGCDCKRKKCAKYGGNIYPVTFTRAGNDDAVNKSGLPLEISVKNITVRNYDFNQKSYIETVSVKYGRVKTGILQKFRKQIAIGELEPVYFGKKTLLLPIYPCEEDDDDLIFGVIVMKVPAVMEKLFEQKKEKTLVAGFDVSKASLEALIYVDGEELSATYKQLGKQDRKRELEKFAKWQDLQPAD
jgi:hypothetical protein